MKKLIRDYLLQYLMITAGAILAAFALEEFLVPNTVLDGGITGISIILNQLTLQPISIFIIVLNLPFLLLGFQQLGKRFFVSGIYGMVIFTAFLEVFAGFQNATSSELLAVVFGGVLLGVGVGLVLRSGGCLDGSEVVAMIVSKRSNFSTGQIIFGINVVIYILRTRRRRQAHHFHRNGEEHRQAKETGEGTSRRTTQSRGERATEDSLHTEHQPRGAHPAQCHRGFL